MPNNTKNNTSLSNRGVEDITQLGTRHNFAPSERKSMGHIARRIGFSQSEISALKRIYRGEFDDSNTALTGKRKKQ